MSGAPVAVRFASALMAACSGPPGSVISDPDAAPPFEWATVIDDAPEAVLSACGEADQVFAVGGREGRGFILEWTGDGWYEPSSPAGTPRLWWCTTVDGVTWAVGERGAVLRRVAGEWAAVDTGDVLSIGASLYGVWADATDLWIVGGELGDGAARPVIVHRDSAGWAAIDTAGLGEQVLFKVWGAHRQDVWAVGTGGLILHFDGSAWTPAASPTVDRLIAVWGTAADDAFAVGGDAAGLVLRWDGAAWTRFATTPEPLSGVWRSAGGPLYVGGTRGWLGRFAAPAGAPPQAAALTSTVAVADADIHALYRAGDSIIAVGADLLGGGPDSWRGHLLVHGGGYGGAVERAPDAGPSDARDPDGAGGQGPGEPCDGVQLCRDGLGCQWLGESGLSICSQWCDTAADCTGYGPDACCVNQCWQSACPICIPASYAECVP